MAEVAPRRRDERPLVLVTGSSGLLGARICKDLSRDHRVVGMDLREDTADDHDWIQLDLTDDASVAKALRTMVERHGDRLASVIHLAAYYDFSGEPSPMYEELTVEGTRRLLRALREMKAVEQFVFSSSMLVMKAVEPGQVLTEDSPEEAEWDYPQSKLDAERVIREEHGSIPAVSLRIAGVYSDDCDSIPIAQQIHRIHQKQLESFLFPGNPDHGQAFVHVDDVVTAVRKTVEHRADLAPYEVFLIGEPDVVSYAELQDVIGEQLHDREWPTIRIPAPIAKAGAWVKQKAGIGEDFIQPWMIDLADAHMPVDPSKAARLLGWKPQRRLRQTLPEMLARLKRDPKAWYERHDLPVEDVDEQHEETPTRGRRPS